MAWLKNIVRLPGKYCSHRSTRATPATTHIPARLPRHRVCRLLLTPAFRTRPPSRPEVPRPGLRAHGVLHPRRCPLSSRPPAPARCPERPHPILASYARMGEPARVGDRRAGSRAAPRRALGAAAGLDDDGVPRRLTPTDPDPRNDSDPPTDLDLPADSDPPNRPTRVRCGWRR